MSHEEKGNAFAANPSPSKAVSANKSTLDEFSMFHRDVMADTVNMSLSQRLLVADAHRQFGEERDISANSGGDDVGGDREPSGNTGVEMPRRNTLVDRRNLRPKILDQVDFRPTCYHQRGIFGTFWDCSRDASRSES